MTDIVAQVPGTVPAPTHEHAMAAPFRGPHPAPGVGVADAGDDHGGRVAEMRRLMARLESLDAAAARTLEARIDAIRADYRQRLSAIEASNGGRAGRIRRALRGERREVRMLESLRDDCEAEIAAARRRHSLFKGIERQSIERRLHSLYSAFSDDAAQVAPQVGAAA